MRKIFFLPVLLLFIVAEVKGQKDDSARLREVLNSFSMYKQLPVSLIIQVKNSADVVMRPEDTMQYRVGCYFNQHGSYVSFGEVEQLADDSLLVFVEKKARRMIIYHHPNSVMEQLRSFVGIAMSDSSAQKIRENYDLRFSDNRSDVDWLTLISKQKIPGTSIPKDSVNIVFDPKSSQLKEIKRTKSSVMLLDRQEYLELQKQDVYKNALLASGDSAFCLVRKSTVDYSYLKVSRLDKDKSPTLIGDRLVADGRGYFRPVGIYADFVLVNGN